jgi:hypothetical protein
MSDRFEMSMMGKLKFFLGFQIKQPDDGTFLAKRSILMIFSRSLAWTRQSNGHLDLDMGGKSVDQKVYRSIIGSLLYLCASRPNIMLSVYVCKISRRTQ